MNSAPHRTVLLAADRGNSIIGEIVDGKTNAIAYSAYGEQSAQQDVETQLGFNGQLREANIGWYLLGNGYRAYNPRLMRFHSPDNLSPFGKGGLNAYMYCGGKPVMNSDPSGHVFSAMFRAFFNNLTDAKNAFFTSYRANVAVTNNPVGALVSTVKGPDMSNALNFLPTNRTTTFGTRTSASALPTAKAGGLHHKVGGLPSSTPDPGSNASLPGSSRGGPGGGYRPIIDSPRPSSKSKTTIWTRYPEDTKRSLSPESQKRVKDIRDRKDPV